MGPWAVCLSTDERGHALSNRFSFHDHHDHVTSLREAVARGFSLDLKQIPPRYFYDQAGSRLFDGICTQPEYYVPDAEREILQRRAAEISSLVGQGAVVIEPGAGNGAKIRILLDTLRPRAYVPMDISGDYLRESAGRLAGEYPWLEIHACCTDFTQGLGLPRGIPQGRRLVFFPGSSLGNFDPDEAADFLNQVAGLVGDGGFVLIGVDIKKDAEILDAAYNDRLGLTAAFNLNLLERINRELGANIDVSQFRHHAFYNADLGRIEMHLISRCAQVVQVDGHRYHFSEGEAIHTESSYKYAPAEFQALARRSGLAPVRYWLDSRGLFSVHLLRVSEA